MKKRYALAVAAVTAFFLPLLLELAGSRILLFRDAFSTHLPIKLFALSQLARGIVPFLNWGASNVEPLLANPNTFSLYPSNLLYALVPAPCAFNLHLLLDVAWAFLGAAALCRRFGVKRDFSWVGGAAYAFSGPFLSYAAAFSNSCAAAAWAPWAVEESVRLARAAKEPGGRRLEAAFGVGIAFGLQFLAGEPAISAWTAVLALGVALGTLAPEIRRSATIVRAFGFALLSALTGGMLAAPLLLTTRAAIPWSFRGEHLFLREQFSAAANVPARFLEWLLPLVYGSPRPLIAGAFWAYRPLDSLQPYLYSLNIGLAVALLVAAALSMKAFRSRRGIAALCAAALLFLLLSFGFHTPLFEVLYAIPALRHFRYPIKFYLPFTLCVAVLAAAAAESLAQAGRRTRIRFLCTFVAAILLSVETLVLFDKPGLVRALTPLFVGLDAKPADVLPGIFARVQIDGLLGLAVLALLAFAPRRGARGPAAAITLAAVLISLLPSGWDLFVSAPAQAYLAAPPLSAKASGGRLCAASVAEFAVARFGSDHRYEKDDVAELITTGRKELWPLTGLPEGIEYSFDEDPDGSYGFLDRVMREALTSAEPLEKVRLLRNSSVRYFLSDDPAPLSGFHSKAEQSVSGRTLYLSEADEPVPVVRAARRIGYRSSISGAIDLLKSDHFDPEGDAVLRGNDQDSEVTTRTSLSNVSRAGNSLAATVTTDAPSAVIFAVTYFRYWKARVDGRPAAVEIANGSFCAVRVPFGTHRVELFYDEAPFQAGAALALAFGAALTMQLFRRPRSRRAPES